MDLMALVSWVSDHWDDIAALVAALMTAASIFAKLTPTKWDDAKVARAARFLAWPGFRKPRAK